MRVLPIKELQGQPLVLDLRTIFVRSGGDLNNAAEWRRFLKTVQEISRYTEMPVFDHPRGIGKPLRVVFQ